jgi:hypothetical protein
VLEDARRDLSDQLDLGNATPRHQPDQAVHRLVLWSPLPVSILLRDSVAIPSFSASSACVNPASSR